VKRKDVVARQRLTDESLPAALPGRRARTGRQPSSSFRETTYIGRLELMCWLAGGKGGVLGKAEEKKRGGPTYTPTNPSLAARMGNQVILHPVPSRPGEKIGSGADDYSSAPVSKSASLVVGRRFILRAYRKLEQLTSHRAAQNVVRGFLVLLEYDHTLRLLARSECLFG